LFEDNKVVSRNHSKSKEDNTMALQKDKQWSTKHYTKN